MHLQSRNKIKIGPGATAMANLVLLLLFFFIIMSLIGSKNQMAVSLPKATMELPQAVDSTATTVVITENNTFYLLPTETADKARSFEAIQEQILLEVGNSGQAKLKIAGHKNATYEALFNILGLAQSNGWQPILMYDK
jgi:biopolymer transport protein ExbD